MDLLVCLMIFFCVSKVCDTLLSIWKTRQPANKGEAAPDSPAFESCLDRFIRFGREHHEEPESPRTYQRAAAAWRILTRAEREQAHYMCGLTKPERKDAV